MYKFKYLIESYMNELTEELYIKQEKDKQKECV